jgi:hypothetical protein
LHGGQQGAPIHLNGIMDPLESCGGLGKSS